jgi:hypothetical protein
LPLIWNDFFLEFIVQVQLNNLGLMLKAESTEAAKIYHAYGLVDSC